MEIAVLVNHDGGKHPFYDKGNVHIYSDDSGRWQKTRELEFTPIGFGCEEGLALIHRQMQTLISNLGTCKALVSPVIRGIPFAILDSEGFTVWQDDGDLGLLFDHIRKTIKERVEKGSCSSSGCGSECTSSLPEPQAINKSDEYFFDLKTILEKDERLNSKELIVPFINKREFKKLIILCDHVPRWLEKDYELFNLLFEEEETDDGVLVTLSPDPLKKHELNIPYPINGCGKNHSSCFEG